MLVWRHALLPFSKEVKSSLIPASYEDCRPTAARQDARASYIRRIGTPAPFLPGHERKLYFRDTPIIIKLSIETHTTKFPCPIDGLIDFSAHVCAH